MQECRYFEKSDVACCFHTEHLRQGNWRRVEVKTEVSVDLVCLCRWTVAEATEEVRGRDRSGFLFRENLQSAKVGISNKRCDYTCIGAHHSDAGEEVLVDRNDGHKDAALVAVAATGTSPPDMQSRAKSPDGNLHRKGARSRGCG